MKRSIRSCGAILGLVLVLHLRTEAQASPRLTLDVDATSAASPVLLTRPQSGVINLGLLYDGVSAALATLQTSPFSSENGSVSFDIVDCQKTRSIQSQPYAINLVPNSLVHFCFFVPALAAGSKYTGKLIASIAGAPPYVRAITVVPLTAALGTLVLDHNAVTRTVRRSWWRPEADDSQMDCSVTVQGTLQTLHKYVRNDQAVQMSITYLLQVADKITSLKA